MVCPRCDGQGLLRRVRVNATGEEILLCDECDAVWTSADQVGRAPHADFSTYVAPFGLRGLWSEITRLEPDDDRA